MVTQFNRLDVLSNNLANANTNGFKRDDVVVGDFLRLFEEAKEELPLENHTRAASRFLNRTLNRVPSVVEEYTDMTLGHFMRTENALDVALSDQNAFFAIKTPSGIRYTRDGSFSLSGDGTLVTKLGHPVLSTAALESGIFENGAPENAANGESSEDSGGFIVINQSANNVEISKDGSVFVRELNNDAVGTAEPVGAIAVVSFLNPKYLKKVGDNLYEIPPERLNERHTINNQNVLVSGFIEKSNINPVLEMTYLISVNRLVDAYSKVLKTHQDELNNEAITKLAQKA